MRAYTCGGMELGCVGSQVQKLASETAQSGQILELPAPAPNSSYNLHFFGPSLDCGGLNSSQQNASDHYANQAIHTARKFTLSEINSTYWKNWTKTQTNLDATFMVWSAFAPNYQLFPNVGYFENNFVADIGPNIYDGSIWAGPAAEDLMDMWTQQLLIQLFNESIVCQLVNLSFDITVDFLQGKQTITYNEVKNLGPFWLNYTYVPEVALPGNAYFNIFAAMATMVNKNITIDAEDRIEDETSQVLTTSLLGCPELNLTRWREVSNAAMGDYVYQEGRINTQKWAHLSEYYTCAGTGSFDELWKIL
jgi:hypothetical protein